MYLSDRQLGSWLSKGFHKLAPILAPVAAFVPGLGPIAAAGITALDTATRKTASALVAPSSAQAMAAPAPAVDAPYPIAPAAPAGQPIDYNAMVAMMQRAVAPPSAAPVVTQPQPQQSTIPPWLLPAGFALAALVLLRRQ